MEVKFTSERNLTCTESPFAYLRCKLGGKKYNNTLIIMASKFLGGFATLKIIIQLSRMLKNKHMLNLESNAQKFIEDFNNDTTAMIS